MLVGMPIGLWLLAWLYWGAPAVPVPWRLVHANAQIAGFFGVLIPGMAQHVLARFAGRPAAPHPAMRWIWALLAAGLGLRILDAAAGLPPASLGAALAQAAAFTVFAAWVRGTLSAAPSPTLRRHLTASAGWLAAAMLLEAWLRWDALGAGVPVPGIGGMRAVHALALYGGVLSFVLGVLLRAGPMFLASWRVPPGAPALAWAMGGSALVAAVGELRGAEAVARLGELLAVSVMLATLLRGGAFRRRPAALPMLGRTGEEARIFRLALGSAAAAGALLLAATGLAAAGQPAHLVADAARHLVTVGLLTSVVVALAFRLIPAIESRPLAWPGLRGLAFWALCLAVVLRTAEVAVGLGGGAVAPAVPLSGIFAWVAVLCVAANLRAPVRGRPRGGPGPIASRK